MEIAATYSSAYFGAYMGAFCAMDSSQCPQEYTRVGIGAQYAQIQNHKNKTQTFDSQIYGGYLNLEGGIASKSRRTRFVIIANLGVGRQNASTSSPVFAKQKLAIFGEIRPKAGVNLATQKFPLYLNVAYTFDAYTSRTKSQKNGYSYLFHYLGGELEGAIPFGAKIALEYALGYDWLFVGGYGFEKSKDSSLSGYSLKEHSYALRASVGASYAVSERKIYYIKFGGKYENLGQSKTTSEGLSMPSLRNLAGMLEMGIGF